MLARTKQLTYHINHTRKTTIYRLCIISPILLSFCSVISLVISSCKIYTIKDGAGINAFCLQNANTRPRSSARRLYPLHSLPLFGSVFGRGEPFRFALFCFAIVVLSLFLFRSLLHLTNSRMLCQFPKSCHNHYTPTTTWGLVRTNKQQEPDLLSYRFCGYAFNDLHTGTALYLFRAVLGLAICAESVIRPLLLFDLPPMPLLTTRSLIRHSFVLLRTRSLVCLPPPYSVG